MRQTRIALGGKVDRVVGKLSARFNRAAAGSRQRAHQDRGAGTHAQLFSEPLESRILFTTLPAWVAPNSVAVWNASAHTLTVTGPTTIIADPAGPGAPASPTSIAGLPTIIADGSAAQIKVNYDANIAGAQGTSASSISLIHIAGLSLTEGATMEIESTGANRTDADHYCLVIGAIGLATPPVFNLDQNGIPDTHGNFTPITSTLDLTDNDLLVLCAQQVGASAQALADGKVEGNIQADLQNAFDGGAWDQPGLSTSVAPTASQGCALGYATSDELACTSFDGVTLGSGAVMVKYTLIGDTQLTGTVSGSDDNIVLNNYDSPGDWNHANFFYTGSYSPNGTFLDGTVDYSDFYGVWGSYDVPGVTATAALARGLTITTDPVNPQSTLDIAWDTPAEGGNFTYDLYGSPDGINFTQINTAPLSGNFFPANTIDGQTALTPGTKYYFYVTVDGSGINSATRSMVTSIAIPTATVAADGTQITLTSQSAAAFVSFPNPVNYTWAALTVPTGAASPGFSTNGNGSAMTTSATVQACGDYIFRVSVTDSAGTVLSTADVPVTVTPVPTVSVSPSAVTLGAGQGQQFTVTATDQFGNTTNASGAAWSVGDPTNASGNSDQGSINSIGYYTAPSDTGGTFIVTACLDGQFGFASVSAAPVITQQATYTQPSPTTVQLAMDAASDDDLEYSWQVTSSPSGVAAPTGDSGDQTATFDLAGAGSYTFQCTATDPNTGLSATSNVSVKVAQVATSIKVASDSASEDVSQSSPYSNALQFNATELDQFCTPMSWQPGQVAYKWSVTDPSMGSVELENWYEPDPGVAAFDPSGNAVGLTEVKASLAGITGVSPLFVYAGHGSVTPPATDPSALPAVQGDVTFSSPDALSIGPADNVGGVDFAPQDGSGNNVEVDIGFDTPVDSLGFQIAPGWGGARPAEGYGTATTVQVYTSAGLATTLVLAAAPSSAYYQQLDLSAYHEVTSVRIITPVYYSLFQWRGISGQYPIPIDYAVWIDQMSYKPIKVALTAYRTGNNFGVPVSPTVEESGDPTQYVVPVNDGFYQNLPNGQPDDSATTAPIQNDKMELNSTGSPVDPDFAKLTLFPTFGLTSGTLTLAASDPSAIQLFKGDGTELNNLTVNLADPSGDLQPLATGSMDVWFEGLKADPNEVITLTYTDSAGNVIATDSIHIDIVDLTFVGTDGQSVRGVANIGLSDLIGDASGDPDAAPILPSEEFKVSLQGLDESQLGQVTVQSTDDPQDNYTDTLTGSGTVLTSTNFAVLYDDPTESQTITSAQRSEVLSALGLNAVHNQSATTTVTTASGLDSFSRQIGLGPLQTLQARLQDAINLYKKMSFYTVTGMSQLLQTMQNLAASDFFSVRWANPGELTSADALYDNSTHTMVIKPSLDTTTAIREMVRALEDQNGWYTGSSDAAYLASSALEWGVSDLITDSKFLSKLDKLQPGPGAAAQAVTLWNEAWAVSGLLGIYQEEVPLDNNQLGRPLTSADLWDVNAKLGVHFSAGVLRPIYEQMLAAKGINVPGGLPAVNIPAGDALQ
jgi:hypothetical protein